MVVLHSGDRITCEIKSLQKGYLEVRTTSLSDVEIVWADVAYVKSVQNYWVLLDSGAEYIGTINSPAENQLSIADESGSVITTVALWDIVEIRPVRSRFLDRIDGSLQVGFTLARANRQRQWSLDGTAVYNGRLWYTYGSASSSFSSQANVQSTSRNELNLESGRYLPRRWFYAGMLGAEQNEELGLLGRLETGGGIGRRVMDTNRRSFQVMGGLLVTIERFEDIGERQKSLESFFVCRYDGFRRVSPKLDTSITFTLLPSLTETGRVRGELRFSTSVEALHNFFVGVSGFDSFDSRPPDANLTKNDYSVSTTLRWKF